MSSILNKLLSIVLNTAIKESIAKPLGRAMRQNREDSNQQLGYDEVQKRIDKRSTYAKSVFIHLIIFIVALPILRFFAGNNPYSSAAINTLFLTGFWAIFVLIPHGGAVLFYYARWSPKELEPFEKVKREKAERKRNSRSDYNFSEDWDK